MEKIEFEQHGNGLALPTSLTNHFKLVVQKQTHMENGTAVNIIKLVISRCDLPSPAK